MADDADCPNVGVAFAVALLVLPPPNWNAALPPPPLAVVVVAAGAPNIELPNADAEGGAAAAADPNDGDDAADATLPKVEAIVELPKTDVDAPAVAAELLPKADNGFGVAAVAAPKTAVGCAGRMDEPPPEPNTVDEVANDGGAEVASAPARFAPKTDCCCCCGCADDPNADRPPNPKGLAAPAATGCCAEFVDTDAVVAGVIADALPNKFPNPLTAVVAFVAWFGGLTPLPPLAPNANGVAVAAVLPTALVCATVVDGCAAAPKANVACPAAVVVGIVADFVANAPPNDGAPSRLGLATVLPSPPPPPILPNENAALPPVPPTTATGATTAFVVAAPPNEVGAPPASGPKPNGFIAAPAATGPVAAAASLVDVVVTADGCVTTLPLPNVATGIFDTPNANADEDADAVAFVDVVGVLPSPAADDSSVEPMVFVPYAGGGPRFDADAAVGTDAPPNEKFTVVGFGGDAA